MSYLSTVNTNLLIIRDKKNVVITSSIIFLAGAFQLIFISFSNFLDPLSITTFMTGGLYIVAGIFGIITTRNNSIKFTCVYLAFLIVIMCVDIIIMIGSIVLIILVVIDNHRCKHCNDDTGLYEAIIFILAICAVVSIVSIIFIKVAYSMGKVFKKDIQMIIYHRIQP